MKFQFRTGRGGCWVQDEEHGFTRVLDTSAAQVTTMRAAEALGLPGEFVKYFLVENPDGDVAVAAEDPALAECGFPAGDALRGLATNDPGVVFSTGASRDPYGPLHASDPTNHFVDSVLLLALNLFEGLAKFARWGVPLRYITGDTIVYNAAEDALVFTQLGYAGTDAYLAALHGDPALAVPITPPEAAVMTGSGSGSVPDPSLEVMLAGDVYALGVVLRDYLTYVTGDDMDPGAPRSSHPDILNRQVVEGMTALAADMAARDVGARPTAAQCYARAREVLGMRRPTTPWRQLGVGSFGCVGVQDDTVAVKLYFDALKSKRHPAVDEAREGLLTNALDPAHVFTLEALGPDPQLVRSSSFPAGEVRKCRTRVPGKVVVTRARAGTHNLGDHDIPTLTGFARALTGLFEGLVQFETLGFMHRDIKLENIVMDPSTGTYKFIDFGLAGAKTYVAQLAARTRDDPPRYYTPPYFAWGPEYYYHGYVYMVAQGKTPMVTPVLEDILHGAFAWVATENKSCHRGVRIDGAYRATTRQLARYIQHTSARLGSRSGPWLATDPGRHEPPLPMTTPSQFKCGLYVDDMLAYCEAVRLPEARFASTVIGGVLKCVGRSLGLSPEDVETPEGIAAVDAALASVPASAAESGGMLPSWFRTLASKSDVYALGLCIMDVLATYVPYHDQRFTPEYKAMFELARSMVTIDVDARAYAVEARDGLRAFLSTFDRSGTW